MSKKEKRLQIIKCIYLWICNSCISRLSISHCLSNRYIDHGDGLLVLRIKDPFVLDSGVYRCVVTSSVGKCETSCPVIVTELDESSSASEQQLKPHFSKPPLPVVSHPGAEVAFSARISPPQSRISWYLNGREIGQDPSAHFQVSQLNKREIVGMPKKIGRKKRPKEIESEGH